MKSIGRIRGNRSVGFVLVLLGCIFFVVRGIQDESAAMHSGDFLPVYSGARCMVKGLDPYNREALLEVNRSSGADQKWTAALLPYENPVYPPTSLFLLTPLGAMGWVPAHDIWLLLEGISFAAATLLIWDLCADDAPVLSGALLCLFTASSTLLMMTANPTSLAVGLCVVGVWCGLRQRMEWLGVICFAISLLLKPQIGGFVWLYLLLCAPIYRRFAWKVLAASGVMAIPAIGWISLMPASHHWLPELIETVRTSMGPGGTADPGISNPTSYAYLNLQSVFAMVWGDPRVYDMVSYAISGPLIALWLWVTVKNAPTRRMTYLGLASCTLVSLLPVYHRIYDGRLLLLIFPAAMLLWAERSLRGWLAVGCVAGMTLVLLNGLYHFLRVRGDAIYAGPLWLQLAGRPYPFVTLVVAAIYLWIYLQAARGVGEAVAEEEAVFAAAG